MRLSLEQKLRTGHVKRWQIVRVAREQTIAEHMYRVYHIATEIALALGLSGGQIYRIRDWALLHDLPEVVTGDIATPTKRAMRKAIPDQDPVRHIELSLDQEYTDLYLGLKDSDQLVLDVVKLADMMEAINFLIVEGMGTHAEEVEMGLRVALMEKMSAVRGDHPEFSWSGVTAIFDEICVRKSGYTPAPAYPVTA